jgi:hypothetical protein
MLAADCTEAARQGRTVLLRLMKSGFQFATAAAITELHKRDAGRDRVLLPHCSDTCDMKRGRHS